jgi:phosphatidylserine decarboxylase
VVSYASEGYICQQGEECGFIKFGSRVDLIVPANSQVKVGIGDIVKGGLDVIAILHAQG